MRVYAIKDEVIGFTGAIMTAQNDEQIARWMKAMVNDKGTEMNLWPKDYSAWYVGEMDKITGNIKEVQPQLVVRANSLIEREEEE